MGSWRKWHTDIHSADSSADRQLKPSRLRWAGYVEHGGE
jgi:hypothetical protein